MKTRLRLLVIVLALIWYQDGKANKPTAFEPSVQVTPAYVADATVLAQGICHSRDQIVDCLLATKNNAIYLIFFNEREVLSIYSVDKSQQFYKPDEMRLLWAKDSI